MFGVLRRHTFSALLPCRATARAMSSRKPGVATDGEMAAFFAANERASIVVVDARSSDFDLEPGDQGSIAMGALAGTDGRGPRALNLSYDRTNKCLDMQPLTALVGDDKAVPIITHCGGGGRGQKAKAFLEGAGFENVINGGGPSVEELWEQFKDV